MTRSLPYHWLALVVAFLFLLEQVDAQQLLLQRKADQTVTLQLDADPLVRFQLPRIAGAAPEVTLTDAGEGWQRMELCWELAESVVQAEVSVQLDLFPGWLHPESLEPAEIMSQTPETAMSVTFLLKLAQLTGRDKYRTAAVRAMDCLLTEVVPQGRWEDYETYWSCCRFGREDHVGRKYERNMENYGHGGRTSPEGGGIGVFTIYDWGNGAASEARNRIYDHYGDVFLDQQRGLAFGIDAVAVKRTADALVLENQDQQSRQLTIRYSNGATRQIQLQDQHTLPR